MISSLATPATGEPRNGRGRVAARLEAAQPGGVEAVPDLGDVLDADPVVLDVLAVGDVGGVAGEVDADAAQRPHGLGREQPAVGADPQHEVAVVELLLLEHRGLAAVDAGLALGVEPHPAEPAAQVGGVDRVEAALGVDVEDPGADVERVVVLLGLLVLVQRLGVAERPLALRALGARDLGVTSGLGLETKVWHGTGPCSLMGRARRWARNGGGAAWFQRSQHIALRVRPKSTWRRATRYLWVAAMLMSRSLRGWTPFSQGEIP